MQMPEFVVVPVFLSDFIRVPDGKNFCLRNSQCLQITFKNEFDVMKMHDHYTNDRFFTNLRSVKIDTLTGIRYSYSNEGMELSGIVLEKTYGLSCQQLLRKYITGPLNIPATPTALLISDATSYTKGYSVIASPCRMETGIGLPAERQLFPTVTTWLIIFLST